MVSHTYAYLRISTDKQLHHSQMNAIENYAKEKGIVINEYFIETMSGRKKDRPELTRMLDKLRAGDTVVVWRFDRISRSAQQLIEIAETFKTKNVNFISINNSVDTRTKEGKLFYTIMAGFAEYEAMLTRERVEEGLAAARVLGRIGGRPKIEDKNRVSLERAIWMYEQDKYTFNQIHEETGISKTTLYRYLRKKE
ncbi:recombinase family protein [Paenibacillus sp. TAF43_2]|uniref:recombinase family protein n=1 Tax=Paenibacillus sp. TAF43_2 TaxID=3233069 RepID=UPI003F99F4F7